MWRNLTFILAAVITTVCLGFADPALAQSNAGTGNQGTISNRPRIEIIEKDITKYHETKETFFHASAAALNQMASVINKGIKDLKEEIQKFTARAETDPYVASFADKRLQPGEQCFGGCPSGQKMHWDGNNWRCLEAVLPTCPSGQVFSATTCSCINPCPAVSLTFPPANTPQSFTQAPDSTGACCFTGQINPGTGLCRTCPVNSSWDPRNNRCLCSNGSVVNEGGSCPTCPSPQQPDTNGTCCNPNTMANGICPPACPAGQAYGANGICCAPGAMVPPNTGTCPTTTCPQGTTQQGDRCRCPAPSNALIWPHQSCPTCPAGQSFDDSGQCCPDDMLAAGAGSACLTTLPTCSAATMGHCNLPSTQIGYYQNLIVNGTCDSGFVPQSGPACKANCVSDGSSAQYNLLVGCAAEAPGASNCPRCTSGTGYCAHPTRCQECLAEAPANCGCRDTEELWNGQCVTLCGPGQTRNSQGVCTCAAGQELWNGQCVPACNTQGNEVRNSSGQCVCAANFERWPNNPNGQCVAVCATGLTRQANGQCGCNQGLHDWGAASGANRCQQCVYPSADNIGFNCGSLENLCYIEDRECRQAGNNMAECECMVSRKNHNPPPGAPACLPIESQGVRYFSCQNGNWVHGQ